MTPPLPTILDVEHNCALAPREPHTVALAFTRATRGYSTPVGRLTRLEGIRCDGSPIAVYVGKDGQEVTW